MTAESCPYPADCPVADPDPALLRRMQTHVLKPGTELYRGHKRDYAAEQLVPGVGNSRFAPLPGVAHAYVSRRATPALLESAFHDVTLQQPRIYPHQLAAWSLNRVRLRVEIRLIDLRDPQLQRLGMTRSQLVTSLPAHYPCTRGWAEALHGRHIGGKPTHGLLWHSRQAELHAAADHNPLTSDLLGSGEATEVAVVYTPPAPLRLFENANQGPGPLMEGEGERFAVAVANLIGAAIYPPGL